MFQPGSASHSGTYGNTNSSNAASYNSTYGNIDDTPTMANTLDTKHWLSTLFSTVEIPLSTYNTTSALLYFPTAYLGNIVMAYGVLITLITGVIGNLLVVMVIASRPHLTSTLIYLLNLAVADLLFCIINQGGRVFSMVWLTTDPANLYPWYCKTWFFLQQSTMTISGWTIVAVTIERTLVVYRPLKAKFYCTITTAKQVIAFIIPICMFFQLHFFWSYGPVYETINNVQVQVAACSVTNDYPFFRWYAVHIRAWQDLFIHSLIPFIFLIICNALIISKLTIQFRRRKNMTIGEKKKERGAGSTISSLTCMLLTISCIHLICTIPLRVNIVRDGSDPFGKPVLTAYDASKVLRWALSVTLLNMNHSLNFVLYCVSGKQFRHWVRQLFCRCSLCGKYKVHRQHPGSSGAEFTAQTGTTSQHSTKCTIF